MFDITFPMLPFPSALVELAVFRSSGWARVMESRERHPLLCPLLLWHYSPDLTLLRRRVSTEAWHSVAILPPPLGFWAGRVPQFRGLCAQSTLGPFFSRSVTSISQDSQSEFFPGIFPPIFFSTPSVPFSSPLSRSDTTQPISTGEFEVGMLLWECERCNGLPVGTKVSIMPSSQYIRYYCVRICR